MVVDRCAEAAAVVTELRSLVPATAPAFPAINLRNPLRRALVDCPAVQYHVMGEGSFLEATDSSFALMQSSSVPPLFRAWRRLRSVNLQARCGRPQ